MSKPQGRIAFLLSGRGSTLENLLARIEAGDVAGRVVLVVSDREGAGGLAVARARDLPVRVVSRTAFRGIEAFSHALEEALRPFAPDLVVAGGFLTIYRVPPDLEGRMLNVHPSLLPAFGGKGMFGRRVHEAVLASGCRTTGCTVHFVTDEVDAGPIVDQAVVEVAPDDTPETLAARVKRAERELYPACVQGVLTGAIRLVDGKVVRAA
jgi:phosphoribosylglycinamide formyltransferase-1